MNIKEVLTQFKAVSLEDMNVVSLMNRVDVKFAFKKKKLLTLLSELSDYYNVLTIDNEQIQEYQSLYYDTVDRVFFIQHHNDRVNRNKVRFRKYVGSGLTFLEVKLKNNKGKTVKKRIRVDDIPVSLSSSQKEYVKNTVGEDLVLTPQHWINFHRITFIDKLNTERLTIDIDLHFSNKIKSGSFEDVVVAEIKKERSSQSSKFTYIAKKHHILPIRLSKYCMSTISLNPSVKHNRFKEKVLLINKLKQE
tara:strand:- start:1589 stop:2335 length:747 start_codon:yes stop_codon:yes gene_type:complete